MNSVNGSGFWVTGANKSLKRKAFEKTLYSLLKRGRGRVRISIPLRNPYFTMPNMLRREF